MPQQILQVDQAMLETTLDRMVSKSVEETLNAMLDAEADEIPEPPDTSVAGPQGVPCRSLSGTLPSRPAG